MKSRGWLCFLPRTHRRPSLERAWMSSDRPGSRELGRALRRIPLFPLEDVVLFPHSMIPLHIFETRYRKMVRDVLGSNRLVAISLQLEKESIEEGNVPRVAAI